MNSHLVYLVEAKIQKQRLKDMKDAAKKRKINVTDSFGGGILEESFFECLRREYNFLAFTLPFEGSTRLFTFKISSRPDVTHVVTEFKEMDSVLRKLGKSSINELGDIHVVSVAWFTDCMKAGHVVPVLETHKIQTTSQHSRGNGDASQRAPSLPDYACQRATPLNHCNKKFTESLEVLELHAELRDEKGDYSRALAFRRASCVLKSLPYTISNATQLRQFTNIGDHSMRVIQEVLEEGSCTEVDDILRDPWFQKMKLFTSIFGIGTSKAKAFIEKGWTTIKEAQEGYTSSDWRVQWGLAFHEELVTPVCKAEADFILSQVRQHVDRILSGVILELTGGFRRGKPYGHDVDILMTHPVVGKEKGLLPRLLNSLQSHDILLYGHSERSSYTEDVLTTDYKLTTKGQLDHFEKWIGIFKVPKSIKEQDQNTNNVIYRRVEVKSEANIECVGSGHVLSSTDSAKNGTCLSSKERDIVEDYSKLSQTEINKLSIEPRDWIARRVDLIVSPYDQYFYALVGWTGNKMFNRDLRWYADREMNMKLTSHGLYEKNKGIKLPASSEQEVFQHLQVPYRNPSDRNC